VKAKKLAARSVMGVRPTFLWWGGGVVPRMRLRVIRARSYAIGVGWAKLCVPTGKNISLLVGTAMGLCPPYLLLAV